MSATQDLVEALFGPSAPDADPCPARTRAVAERKRVVRSRVQEMTLAPDSLEVEITYRLPEPVMNGVVAGARCEAFNKLLATATALRLVYMAGVRGRRACCTRSA